MKKGPTRKSPRLSHEANEGGKKEYVTLVESVEENLRLFKKENKKGRRGENSR